MRASCNGCRVLRKGCTDDCTIRPCLAWIRGADAQANATVFLAKFYGRAGLLNLLAAGTDAALRPALFRSLLYEACGRVANPVYGATGLFCMGRWEACQDAVQAVFEGRRIAVQSEAVRHPGLVAAFDVRHVPKPMVVPAPPGPLGVSRAGRTMFKRASSSSTAKPTISSGAKHGDLDRAPSHEEPAGSHDHVVEDGGMAVAVAVAAKQVRGESSADTGAEAHSHVSQAEQNLPMPQLAQGDDDEVGLELTLGFGPATRLLRSPPARPDAARRSSAECGHIGLLLELPV
ncbi:LOB domain-containing protein 42-like [Hordeum vulgare subsp. vulgare]|uniref:LOB domain-containing protein n=1 Tax=Hordeum vulgare subsp. vulgare TaxID=112509 RepID=A0A8I7BDD9_HORVV|nr:LOB domain-containing protein 42-like [Hordeum vulgare subsp. vulgare]